MCMPYFRLGFRQNLINGLSKEITNGFAFRSESIVVLKNTLVHRDVKLQNCLINVRHHGLGIFVIRIEQFIYIIE